MTTQYQAQSQALQSGWFTGRRSSRLRRWLASSLTLSMLTGSMMMAIPTQPGYADANSCATPGKDGAINISDVVNTYFPPISNSQLTAGATSLTVGNAYTEGSNTPISAGDMLMVIQMQDATIDSSNTAAYGSGDVANNGSGQTSLNNTGTYEFVRATNSVPLTGGTLTFEGGGTGDGLVHTYNNFDPTASQGRRTFQVIRVVQYASLTLTSNITVPDWDGQVGGVLALDIAGNMDFNGFTIDADNRGFRGGFVPNDVSNTSGANIGDYVLPGDTTEGSGKGEGIAGTPRYMWDGTSAIDLLSDQLPGGDAGRGAPGNAGGGGNAHNAGGGGGGNGGDGGTGGIGWEGAGGDLDGSRGLGGASPVDMPVGDRLIMGGGGGGGDVNNDDNGIRGGQGGGIVYIQADQFVGAGTITSNGSEGEIGEVVGAPDGAGGGGAGGTVALIAQAGSLSNVTVQARGGDGGNTTGDAGIEHGPGGGGGGGVVISTSPGGQVSSPDLAGGQGGRADSGAGIAHGAENGADGIEGTLNPLSVPPIQPGANCFPSLTVTKTEANPSTPGGRMAPGNANYSITVTNTGSGGASGVQLTDILPSGFTYSSGATATFSGGATGPASPTNSGSASVPVFGDYTIPKDGSVTVNFTANIALGTAVGTYQNPAYATYLDPTRTDANLNRQITASTTPLPGGNTTYESGSNAGNNTPGNNYDSASSTGEDVVIVPALGVYGRVFEDVNYGGGTGRDFVSASGVGRPNVRVELYNNTGDFVAATTTDANGLYEFTSGITDGQSYTVRVVNDTVTSSRSLNAGFTVADTVAVQTFRYDPDEVTPAITDEVGGVQPAFLDSGANTTSANLSTLTTATTTAQSVSTFTLSGPATGVDFGFNFDTIVNTNTDGQGSLIQFVSNSNALDNTGLAQDLPVAITAPLDKDGNAVTLSDYETSIFMIPDPNIDPRVTAAHINLDTTPPDGGTGSAFVIDTSVGGTLNITDPFTSIDGRTQSVNVPSVSNPPNLIVGSNETTGAEIIIQKTSALTVLIGRVDDTIVHSVGVVGDSTSNTIGMLFANNGGNGVQTVDTGNVIVDSVTVSNVAQCGIWGVQMVDSVIRDSVLKETGITSLCDNIQLRHNSDRNLIDNNLILRSEHYGIDIVLTGNSDNVITNNQIVGNGVNNADSQNSGIGLRHADGTLVQNNIIRDNVGDGVTVRPNSGTNINNRITQNSIYNNGGLGIDVGLGNSGDGPTLNDTGDGDSGPNLLQNYPAITSVTSDGTTLTVQGTFNSASNGSFNIEIYSNAVCNPGTDGVAQTDTYGEGEKYHTTLPVNTNGSGDATFSTTVPVVDLAGLVMSATATDAAGNTSEFSECPTASDPNVLLVKRITAINRGGTNEQLFDTSYVNSGTASDADNETNWPGGTETAANGGTVESYINGITSGTDSGVTIRPQDEIEYTISFLSNGDMPAQNVLVCDRIPTNTTFLITAFNSSPPATPGSGNRGIFITFNGSAVALTNANDGDEIPDTGSDNGVGGYYFPPGVEPTTVFTGLNCNGTNTNGAIVVDFSSIPRATGDGTPTNAYGFIRFKVVVD